MLGYYFGCQQDIYVYIYLFYSIIYDKKKIIPLVRIISLYFVTLSQPEHILKEKFVKYESCTRNKVPCVKEKIVKIFVVLHRVWVIISSRFSLLSMEQILIYKNSNIHEMSHGRRIYKIMIGIPRKNKSLGFLWKVGIFLIRL